ncbi:hypothetical protein KQH60_09570 [Mycetohabitans sp. B8]|nr:hypothetical protein [Mycetohabitans sp. B8]MCG1042772.1 hypothetical protein [Mycetohabitans sp. B8]
MQNASVAEFHLFRHLSRRVARPFGTHVTSSAYVTPALGTEQQYDH